MSVDGWLARLVAAWIAGGGPDLLVVGREALDELVGPPPAGGERGGRRGSRRRAPRLAVSAPGERWGGVDEVGRGPLAGPVVACAVVLPPGRGVPGLRDSKALTAPMRLALVPEILRRAVDVRLAIASHRLVDRLDVLQASREAMGAAASALAAECTRLVVDGPLTVPLAAALPQQPVVDGDARVACVAAASVVAKVVRDRLMEEADRLLPGYGFARHKGYPTPEHLEALRRLGPSALHRLSYAPVAAARPRPA